MIALYPVTDSEPIHPAMTRALRHLVAHFREQPSLETMAAAAGMSPFHFQRTFKAWAGISPKRFIQFVTVGHAKGLLAGQASVLDAALDSGLSGPGRLHDLFVACEAMTPGEYKDGGRALTVRWGIHDGPLGPALVAATVRGLCWLSFVEADDPSGGDSVAALAHEWPAARLVHDPEATAPLAARAFAMDDPSAIGGGPLRLHLDGTNFQIQVWRALLQIPSGVIVSYRDIAEAIGRPEAVRAVGQACSANRISYVIPCHRVIRKTGAVHGYRWSVARKRALIALENQDRLEIAGAAAGAVTGAGTAAASAPIGPPTAQSRPSDRPSTSAMP